VARIESFTVVVGPTKKFVHGTILLPVPAGGGA
jgi:hypothetical protein